MPDGSASTYTSLGSIALDAVSSELMEPLVEAAAITLRDAVVEQINQSTPVGRRYRIPGTRYRDGKKGKSRKTGTYIASAPGQAPAEREGIYRERWQNTPSVREADQVAAKVFNDATVGKAQEPLALILEKGHRIPDDADAPETAAAKKPGKTGGRMAPRPHIAPAMEKAKEKIQALIQEASS
jgi:hypothetical protein